MRSTIKIDNRVTAYPLPAMPAQKRDLYRAVFSQCLSDANQGRVFATKSGAMSGFAAFHKNA